METCRLCSESKSTKDLSRLDDKKLGITKKLSEAFSINLNNSNSSSPNFCCRICLKKLNSSYTFYQQVVENQKKYETNAFNFDSVVVKVENLDDRNLGNFSGSIKVENEEHFEDDFGDSFGGGDFYGDSNDYKEENEDQSLQADDITIQKILDSTEAGTIFMNSMKNKTSLLTKEKRKLVEIVVKYFMQHKIKLFKADFKRLSEEIPKIFPQELSDTYFSDDGKLAGILYFKYNNTLSMYRRNDQMSCMTKKRKIDKDNSTSDSESHVTFGSEEISSDEYVRNTKTFDNFEKLMLHWKVSTKVRKHKINTVYSNFKEILNDYGAYARPDGYMLDSRPLKSSKSISKKTTKKQPKTTLKPKKPSKTTKKKQLKEPKFKDEKKQPTVPKEDFLDAVYKNENDGKFTDNFLRLNIHANEYLPDGRLTPEAEANYSSFKWSNYDYKCTEDAGKCLKSFKTIIDLDAHLKAVHKTKYKSVCSQCGIISSNYSGYVTHIIKYHNTNARFSCIICSTIFCNLNDLFKHYKNDHSNRILMCLYCGFHYNTFAVLRTHLIQNHKHEDNRDIFICDMCNFSTKTKQNIISHMKSHTLSTRLICDQCGAMFKRRGVLDMHKSSIHGNQEATAQCHCGKSFKNLLSLRKHKKIVHQKYMHVYNYECSFCDKKFRTPYQLKCHMYSHDQNSARYQCPHCEKAFRYTSGYQYHIRSAHTMEKPYGCPCCDNKFFDYANAQKHVKGSHGGNFKPIRIS